MFEEGRCVVAEPCGSVANCWLVWEVAGGDSHISQPLCGRYEMCMHTDGCRLCVDTVHVPDIPVVLSLYDSRKSPIRITMLNSILQ